MLQRVVVIVAVTIPRFLLSAILTVILDDVILKFILKVWKNVPKMRDNFDNAGGMRRRDSL